MNPLQLSTVDCKKLPDNPDLNTVYRLLPNNPDEAYYRERTDRNIGWITEEEQSFLRSCTVGVAGCGGMGGALAQIFVRLGVGEIRIADCEEFDTSNLNRQFAARKDTIGVSKAIATAKVIRAISDDTTLTVYPQGIVEETVEDFVAGCDVICDEIEFWAIGSRILLHQTARVHDVSIFNCNTVGFGTRLFLFEPTGFTVETCLKFNYDQAKTFQEKVQSKTATKKEVRFVMERILEGLICSVPQYISENISKNDRDYVLKRLLEEGKASIISTNPSMATGFLADHVLFYLLRNSVMERNVIRPPKVPGYLYFDAAFMNAQIVEK